MQTAEKLPGCHLLGNVGDAGMGGFRRWNVVERQTQPGDDLRDKDKEQPGAKYIGQARAARNRFIQRCIHQTAYASTSVEPLEYVLRSDIFLRHVCLYWFIHCGPLAYYFLVGNILAKVLELHHEFSVHYFMRKRVQAAW